MLPYEVFTLVLLFTKAIANPQGSLLPQNATVTAVPTTDHSKNKVHPESTADGWGEPPSIDQLKTWSGCAPNNCNELTVHLEQSMTGWSTTPGPSNVPQNTPEFKQDVISTSTPSLVGIHTEVQPSAQNGGARPGDTPDSTPTLAKIDPAPASPERTPTDDTLLKDIVSKLGIQAPSSTSDPTPEADPASPPSNTEASDEVDATPQPPQTPDTTPSQPTPASPAGTLLTLGPSTLTLTPGLTSLLGTGPTATYIAITTDDIGQTLITVSSSGTAVTATVTNVPTTVSRDGSDFEASITAVARPGGWDSTGAGAVPTSSKGVAAGRGGESGWWVGLGVGVLGWMVG